jgi:hypothetical protein
VFLLESFVSQGTIEAADAIEEFTRRFVHIDNTSTLYLLHVPVLSRSSGGLLRTLFLTLSIFIIKGHCHLVATYTARATMLRSPATRALTKLERDDHVIGPRDSRSMLRLSDNFEVSKRVQV